jgi:hypothetical protein
VWLLVVPLAIVLVLVLAVIVPVVVGTVWLVGWSLHWLGPLLLIWGFFMLMRGPRRRYRRDWARGESPRRSERNTAPPAGWDRPVQPTAAPSPKAPETALPIDVQVKVDQIQRKVEVLLQYADTFPPFSHDLYIVRRTAAEYLPRTIEAYLAVPKRTPDSVLPPPTQSPLDELKQQLQLLDSKLDEIAQDLQRKDLDGLLANRRFLEERFGRRQASADGPDIQSSETRAS